MKGFYNGDCKQQSVKNTIININEMEQIFKMWKMMRFTTSRKTTNLILTFDIPTNPSTSWNGIKGNKCFKLKTIDNPTLINEVAADRNVNRLNQTQGSPFTIEPWWTLL